MFFCFWDKEFLTTLTVRANGGDTRSDGGRQTGIFQKAEEKARQSRKFQRRKAVRSNDTVRLF